MTTRTKRTERLAELAAKAEKQAHRELASASANLRAAETSLEDIFVDCRRVAESSDELSVRFGRALIESGWLAAQLQEERLEQATIEVEQRTKEWTQRKSRVDALGRLLDRIQASDQLERGRRDVDALDDVISSRTRQQPLVASNAGGRA